MKKNLISKWGKKNKAHNKRIKDSLGTNISSSLFRAMCSDTCVHVFFFKIKRSLLNKSSYFCSFEGIRKAFLNTESLRDYAIYISSQKKKMQKDTLPFNENLIFKITMGRKQKQNKIQYCMNTVLSFV